MTSETSSITLRFLYIHVFIAHCLSFYSFGRKEGLFLMHKMGLLWLEGSARLHIILTDCLQNCGMGWYRDYDRQGFEEDESTAS
jgi:hypothetical protein